MNIAGVKNHHGILPAHSGAGIEPAGKKVRLFISDEIALQAGVHVKKIEALINLMLMAEVLNGFGLNVEFRK